MKRQRPIVPTRKPGEPYSEAELAAMEGNRKKSREYFVNVAFNARNLCIGYYLDGHYDKAQNLANYSDAILEHLDAFMASTADTNTVADVINEAIKAKRDQQRRR